MENEGDQWVGKEVSIWVYTRHLTQLKQTTKLHDVSITDAFNQAIQLWLIIAENGWIGKPFSIVMEEELPAPEGPPRSRWTRFLARFVTTTVSRRAVVHVILPGDSAEVLAEKVLRRLHDER